jgi:integrase/recombinase XerD
LPGFAYFPAKLTKMTNLQSVTQDFLLHSRVEKHLSPKTIKAYSTDLRQFTGFIRSTFGIDEISLVGKQQLREYLATIEQLKPKSVKRKIATIKALFNYLEFEDRITINPLRKMRIRIKEPHILPSVMDLQEVMKIFKVGYKQKEKNTNESSYSYEESVRNIAVLELLFSTGARVSEIACLKITDINLQTGLVIIKGKGNKERVIQICNKESITTLKNYQSLVMKKYNGADGHFLVNRFSRPLSDQSIRNLVKKLVFRAGIKRRITPHTFRHSFATLLLEKDVDIKYIQSLLGHSSINTTQIYTHVNRKRQRELLKNRHPRREFSMIDNSDQ